MLNDLKERYRQFREWQHRPHEVAPLSAIEHDCPTCNTHYTGNYCPRCGQSAKIGRYSFKNAFLLFIDVWGLGNRGMFRSLRDLLLRPGYMIRDYLKGMQMAYFPPFKMLFLLTALSVVVAHGLNIQGRGYEELSKKELADYQSMTGDDQDNSAGIAVLRWMSDVTQRFPNIITLLSIGFWALLLYPLFRHSKNIPDMRFSEFLIAMVYSANMMTIWDTGLAFFCLDYGASTLVAALVIVPLKQLSGFSWKRTIFSVLLAFFLLVITIILFFVLMVVSGLIHIETP